MPRDPRGYDYDDRRTTAPSSRRPADPPPSTREDRHRSDRREARERQPVLEDPPRSERPVRTDRERERERERERPDRGDDAMDYTAAPRPAARGDPRANTGVRREERETITAYRDPRTGQLRDAVTHEVLDAPRPAVARPRDYDDDRMMMDRDEPPPRRRERDRERERERERDTYDSRAPPRTEPDDFGRGSNRSGYGMNDFFVEKSGIEREVITHDICRYLGNDATVRKFTNRDGREGYLVTAYRALTSAQLEDLRQDSAKYRRNQRSGRGADSYAEMRARDEPGYPDAMDIDDEFEPQPLRERHRESDLRGDRSDRHRLTPVTSGYVESGVPSYALGTNQGGYGASQVPRTAGGNYSPSGGRPGQSQYPPASYDSRTSAPTIASIPTTQGFRDPRTGQFLPAEPVYGGGFAPEPTRGGGRHR